MNKYIEITLILDDEKNIATRTCKSISEKFELLESDSESRLISKIRDTINKLNLSLVEMGMNDD